MADNLADYGLNRRTLSGKIIIFRKILMQHSQTQNNASYSSKCGRALNNTLKSKNRKKYRNPCLLWFLLYCFLYNMSVFSFYFKLILSYYDFSYYIHLDFPLFFFNHLPRFAYLFFFSLFT